MVKHMERAHLSDDINGMGTIPEIYFKVAQKMRNAVFDLGNGELVTPSQNHSGRLNTANDNSIFNIAQDNYEARIVRTRYPHVHNVIGDRKNFSVLGDDSIKDYLLTRPMTVIEQADWGEAIQNSATEVGFDLNAMKCLRRSAYGEYLKILYMYGYLVPQLGRLMPFSSERVNTIENPIESMRGLISFYRTMVSRGSNHELMLRLVHHIWNIKRGLKKQFFKTRATFEKAKTSGAIVDKFVDYPFAVMWVPQSLGGIGELPFTLLGASKDAMIYLWTRKFPGLREAINKAAHHVSSSSDANRLIAQQILASGQMDKYLAWLKLRVYDNSQLLAAKEERARYRIPLGDLEISHAPQRRIQRTLAGSSKITSLAVARKEFQAAELIERGKSPAVIDYLGNMFSWLEDIDVDFEGDFPFAQTENVIVGRDESVARFERALGFSTVSSDQKSRMTAIFRLLNTNYFNAEAEIGYDTLMALFTRPDINYSVDLIASVAVRIGSSRDRAVIFANRFVTSFDSAVILEKGQKFSSGDEFGSSLDLSFSRLAQILDIPVWIYDSDVRYLSRQLCIMMLLTIPIWMDIKRPVLRTFGDVQSVILEKLMPKFNVKSQPYLQFHPLNTYY
jgi:hypothetical protein